MRISLLSLGVTALLTVSAGAQSTHVLFEMSTQPHVQQHVSTEALQTPPVPTIPATAKSGESTQSLTFTKMYQADFYPSWEMFNANRTFWYDAATHTTVFIRTNRVFTNNALSGGQVRLYTTKDNGATWNEIEVFNQPNKFLGFPNFGIMNPLNSGTTFKDLNWVAFCSFYQGPLWNRDGQIGLFSPQSGVFDFPMPAPDNAPTDMGWNVYGDMTSLNGPNPAVYHVQRLNKEISSGPSQYGMYGMWGYDFDAEDFTANSVPAAWDISQFQQPDPPNINSTLNSSPRISSDKDGKLYMAANLIFVATPGVRVPAISTSEDQGVTWSAFVQMPASVLDAYKTANGWDNIATYGAYDMDAFVVTGPNKWSYIYRVGTSTSSAWAARDLVEAKYDNGTWSMSKIADINGFPLQFMRQDSLSDLEGTNAWVPYYSINDLGNEVEVAVTADGKDLLVKWIDDNPEYTDSNFKQRAFYRTNAGAWVEDEITGISATDIYTSYRPVDGGTWSAPNNLTNDRVYDHATRIPPVIESLHNVPLITLKTITKAEYNQTYPFLPAISLLPDMILDAHVDYRTPNTIQTTFFDATTVSVNEEKAYTFHVNSVSPNPATNTAELAFTMDQPGMVSIDVFATTGVKMATVFNGTLDAGIHGLTVNTSMLATGTYYVSMNVGHQRVTRQLVVLR